MSVVTSFTPEGGSKGAFTTGKLDGTTVAAWTEKQGRETFDARTQR